MKECPMLYVSVSYITMLCKAVLTAIQRSGTTTQQSSEVRYIKWTSNVDNSQEFHLEVGLKRILRLFVLTYFENSLQRCLARATYRGISFYSERRKTQNSIWLTRFPFSNPRCNPHTWRLHNLNHRCQRAGLISVICTCFVILVK